METAVDSGEVQRNLAAGDLRAAGEALIEENSRLVFGVCRGFVKNHETAEDLTHDTFLKALTGLKAFRSDASPRTWLLKIARNGCIDYLRRAKRQPWILTDDGDEPPPSDVREFDTEDVFVNRFELDSALNALEERDRLLVVLRFAHQLDYEALVDMYGIKPSTLRMRLSRALKRMRAHLEEQGTLLGLEEVTVLRTDAVSSARMVDYEMLPTTPPRQSLMSDHAIQVSDKLLDRLMALLPPPG